MITTIRERLLIAALLGACLEASLPAKTPGVVRTAVSVFWVVCLALAIATAFGYVRAI